MRIFSKPRFQEIVIHDLRTPLNVIMLALRMIDDAMIKSDDEMADDLGLIRANADELERMLTVLVDLSKIPETSAGLANASFDPARLIRDTVQYQSQRSGVTIGLDLSQCPAEAFLDETMAVLAVQKVLANTIHAAQGKPVKVRVVGVPERLTIQFIAEAPPRDSVRSQTLSAEQFERVIGTPAERRGLDLSIAARISELFGGSASLEAQPGQGTTLTLDWPLRVPAA